MNRGLRVKILGTILVLGLTGMGLGFVFAILDEARFVHDPTPIFGIVAVAAVFFALLRGPVGRAIGKLLESGDAQDDQHVARVEELEAQVAELGSDHLRMAELEERLDFAERLLAQRLPAAQLERMDTPV